MIIRHLAGKSPRNRRLPVRDITSRRTRASQTSSQSCAEHFHWRTLRGRFAVGRRRRRRRRRCDDSRGRVSVTIREGAFTTREKGDMRRREGEEPPEERRSVLRPVSVALLSATYFLARYHRREYTCAHKHTQRHRASERAKSTDTHLEKRSSSFHVRLACRREKKRVPFTVRFEIGMRFTRGFLQSLPRLSLASPPVNEIPADTVLYTRRKIFHCAAREAI